MQQGVVYALLAAALFGASTPFAKRLLGDVPPLMLAALLYLGSGFGLSVMLGLRTLAARGDFDIAWPVRSDWGWLAGAILFGGFLGPSLIGLLKQGSGHYTAGIFAVSLGLALAALIVIAVGRALVPPAIIVRPTI